MLKLQVSVLKHGKHIYLLTLEPYFSLFALLTSEPVLLPEQTLGSGIEVSQLFVQKYGTVCRLRSESLF